MVFSKKILALVAAASLVDPSSAFAPAGAPVLRTRGGPHLSSRTNTGAKLGPSFGAARPVRRGDTFLFMSADQFTVGVLGDLHIDPRKMEDYYTGREQWKPTLEKAKAEHGNVAMVSLGDLGESKSVRPAETSELFAGTTECHKMAAEYLGSFGVPYEVVGGNHDLEGLDEFETDEENLAMYLRYVEISPEAATLPHPIPKPTPQLPLRNPKIPCPHLVPMIGPLRNHRKGKRERHNHLPSLCNDENIPQQTLNNLPSVGRREHNKDGPQFMRQIAEKTLLVGMGSTVFRSAKYTSHEVTIDDEQMKWFEDVLKKHPSTDGWKIFVFTHAPPNGSGLRVLQENHVVNGCCWLNHSDEKKCSKFIELVREHRCIKAWFSGHFHLGQDYQDSITFPTIDPKDGPYPNRGSCVFVQTSVMRGGTSRDGR
jgi:hypothetical protein